MPYDPLKHHRRSIRLRGYDYSQEGGYFVTICTRSRECTLGDIESGHMMFSGIGRIADECWRAIPDDLPNVTLDEYQIMPNHVHGIVVISNKCAGDLIGRREAGMDLTHNGNPATDLTHNGDPVRDLINQIPPGHQIPPGKQFRLGFVDRKFSGEIDWPLMKNPKQTLGKVIRHFKAKAAKRIHDAAFYNFEWQRGYHDHIIRNADDLKRVRQYIRQNPRHWSLDSENPENDPISSK